MNDDGAAAFLDRRAKKFESEFGVIASAGRLDDLRGAIGVEAGEEHCGFYLSTGHGHFVLNGAEVTAVNFKRRKIIFARANICAHQLERSNDALHGAFLEGFVASNFGGELLTAENAGEQANGGAGIFCVEGAARDLESAEAVTGDFYGGAINGDVGAESLHAAESAMAIASSGEMTKFAGAFGKSGEHGIAMRNGLVAGQL